MKIVMLSYCFAACFLVSAYAETTYHSASFPAGVATHEVISIPEGKAVEVITFTISYYGNSAYLELIQNSITQVVAEATSPTFEEHSHFGVFVGPSILQVKQTHSDSSTTYICYKIFDSAPSNTELIPTASVVIPSDSVGPVSIILESSKDLINWTTATPGIYGSSDSNRFFRVRAEIN